MRPSASVSLAQTARSLSARRLVRVQLTTKVPGLGNENSVVLVHPGRMRNDLFPTKKAIYKPLPTPFTLAATAQKESAVEEQLQQAQEKLQAESDTKSLAKELGPVQLLSLRRNLEFLPTIAYTRQTTTAYEPSEDPSALPSPPLTIQGSIGTSDLLNFLTQKGAFDLATEFPSSSSDLVQTPSSPLNRLTPTQINTVCQFHLLPHSASQPQDSLDRLGRIKKTGQYRLVAHILPSNVRVRIPVVVRPSISSSASTSTNDPSLSTSTEPSSVSTPISATSTSAAASTSSSSLGQTRGYATQASSSSRSSSSASRRSTMEESMRTKLMHQFGPECEITIRNDSSKHAHHAAMVAQGGGNGETHFYVEIISDKFAGMTQIKRHRAVNSLLEAEFERGLHALSLRTKTFAEQNKTSNNSSSVANTAASGSQSKVMDDGRECPRTEAEGESVGRGDEASGAEPEQQRDRGSTSIWTAPQSTAYPTTPSFMRSEVDATRPDSSPSSSTLSTSSSSSGSSYTLSEEEQNILSAFYVRPPSPAKVPQGEPLSRHQKEKFFRRVTKNEQVQPNFLQNSLNVLAAVLAVTSATYMVLFADFDTLDGKSNCFTDFRAWFWNQVGHQNRQPVDSAHNSHKEELKSV